MHYLPVTFILLYIEGTWHVFIELINDFPSFHHLMIPLVIDYMLTGQGLQNGDVVDPTQGNVFTLPYCRVAFFLAEAVYSGVGGGYRCSAQDSSLFVEITSF